MPWWLEFLIYWFLIGAIVALVVGKVIREANRDLVRPADRRPPGNGSDH